MSVHPTLRFFAFHQPHIICSLLSSGRSSSPSEPLSLLCPASDAAISCTQHGRWAHLSYLAGVTEPFQQTVTWVYADIPRNKTLNSLRQFTIHERILPLRKTPWPESASELYRPRGRRLSAKLVPTFVDRGCHVVSVTDPLSRIIDFLDRSRYFFFPVALQLYSHYYYY
jgi:hypothetical protein